MSGAFKNQWTYQQEWVLSVPSLTWVTGCVHVLRCVLKYVHVHACNEVMHAVAHPWHQNYCTKPSDHTSSCTSKSLANRERH